MMIVAAFRWWNGLVLSEAEVATAATTAAAIATRCDATDQEQRLKNKTIIAQSSMNQKRCKYLLCMSAT